MNGYAPYDEAFGRRIEDVIGRFIHEVETEIGHAVGYVDRVVVPEVRREAGSAARTLAGHLNRLADRLDPHMEPDRKQGL